MGRRRSNAPSLPGQPPILIIGIKFCPYPIMAGEGLDPGLYLCRVTGVQRSGSSFVASSGGRSRSTVTVEAGWSGGSWRPHRVRVERLFGEVAPRLPGPRLGA